MSVLYSGGQQLDDHEVGCRHDRRAHCDGSIHPHLPTERVQYSTTIQGGDGLGEGLAKSAIPFKPFVEQRYWPAVQCDLSSAWRETVERYHLPALVETFGRFELSNITPEAVQVWWAQLRRQRRAPATCNKLLVRLKHIFDNAVEWSYLERNPARFVKRAKEPRGRAPHFSNVVRTQLFEKANPNLKLYLYAASYTGGRRRSLLELRERDIDWEQGLITFRATKNGEDHTLPLHPALRAVLEPRRTGQGDAYVLPRYQPAALSRAFKRLTRRLGLEDFRFHDTRHDVASRLARAGANQRLIMDVLGHKDPRASIRYTHLTHAVVDGAMRAALT
jgi:integrase